MSQNQNSSLKSAVGELLCVGFHGTSVSDDMAMLLAEHELANVVLFSRNIASVEQVIELTNDLQSRRATQAPLLIAVDQEGGSVARFRGMCTDFPSMAHLGATADVGLAHAFGSCLGEELTALGVNMDFAPVADLFSRPDNPVIGNRAFGSEPEQVGAMVAAQIRGMEAGALLSCAKHFPGHGDTDVDSHRGLPIIPHDLAHLEKHELPPFIAAMETGVPAIMTAHILFPSLDAHNPATLSHTILQGLLREQLGYDGVIISDDLEMKAITDDPGIEQAVLRGLMAGVDLFLICHRIDRQVAAFEALMHAGESDSATRTRIFQSAERIRRMKLFLDEHIDRDVAEAHDTLRSRNTQTLAKEITRRGQAALQSSGLAVNIPQPSAPELIGT